MTMIKSVKLGFTGDVMIGRAIDRILPDHVNGKLYEHCVKHSDRYIELAERANGELPRKEIRSKGQRYIWGDLLNELKNGPNCLIINLETTLTTHEEPNRKKSIHHRAHPKNCNTLKIAGVNIATVANNHILDWNEEGLKETLSSLDHAGILYAGAGRNREEALNPTIVTVKVSTREPLKVKQETQDVRVKVSAYGFVSADIPIDWAAGDSKYGINIIENPTITKARSIAKLMEDKLTLTGGILETSRGQQQRTIKVVSLHWGPTWDWNIPEQQQTFAHTLIDHGVDVVVGHSSHHIKGIEVYKGKLIAYGLGDFINDYEGITEQGYEEFRNDLCCFYMPTIDTSNGNLLYLDIIPCKIKHLRVQRATIPDDIDWIYRIICREGQKFGTSCHITKDINSNANLRLTWLS